VEVLVAQDKAGGRNNNCRGIRKADEEEEKVGNVDDGFYCRRGVGLVEKVESFLITVVLRWEWQKE
jgi:hypothetical protein